MKIFIDTSVFVRFFTHDIPDKVEECEKIFSLVKDGKVTPYISNVVFMELVFVLTRKYKFKLEEVLKSLLKILKFRNVTLLETTNTKKGLEYYKVYNIKYEDCLIATQVPKGVTLVTYDSDFAKLKFLSSKTPGEFLADFSQK